jgi:toxin-antitoxin system PIN domain toxin
MILPDANLILYAHIKDFPQHLKSKAWLENTLNGEESVGLAWQVITAFVRIGTNPKIFKIPMAIKQVEKRLGTLLTHPNTKLVNPTAKHWQIFLKQLKDSKAAGNLVMDAHLATLAIEHNARLASTDDDFKLFPDLNYFNPLTEK